jgi:hypothetical protein
MMNTISVTCPAEIARINRQARNRKREKNQVLVAIKRKWCEGKTCSCGCGRPANTPHHPRGELYENDAAYIDPDNWEPYYHICHHRYHTGWQHCPTCGKWMRPGSEQCWICAGKPRGKRRRPPRHPCTHWFSQQTCRTERGIKVCPYSAKKAQEQCEQFEKRERKLNIVSGDKN